MTENEEYLDGKVAGLELAFDALVERQLTPRGRSVFADFLYGLSIEERIPPPPPRFQAGLTEALQHLAVKLRGDSEV